MKSYGLIPHISIRGLFALALFANQPSTYKRLACVLQSSKELVMKEVITEDDHLGNKGDNYHAMHAQAALVDANDK